MSKAEEQALKAYPDDMGTLAEVKYISRLAYKKGYEQAKKDILEWLDVKYAEVRQLCDDTDDAVYWGQRNALLQVKEKLNKL